MMEDQALVISHFISEATFTEAIQHHTDKWERPSTPPQPIFYDPMGGPLQPAPLEM